MYLFILLLYVFIYFIIILFYHSTIKNHVYLIMKILERVLAIISTLNLNLIHNNLLRIIQLAANDFTPLWFILILEREFSNRIVHGPHMLYNIF